MAGIIALQNSEASKSLRISWQSLCWARSTLPWWFPCFLNTIQEIMLVSVILTNRKNSAASCDGGSNHSGSATLALGQAWRLGSAAYSRLLSKLTLRDNHICLYIVRFIWFSSSYRFVNIITEPKQKTISIPLRRLANEVSNQDSPDSFPKGFVWLG